MGSWFGVIVLSICFFLLFYKVCRDFISCPSWHFFIYLFYCDLVVRKWHMHGYRRLDSTMAVCTCRGRNLFDFAYDASFYPLSPASSTLPSPPLPSPQYIYTAVKRLTYRVLISYCSAKYSSVYSSSSILVVPAPLHASQR